MPANIGEADATDKNLPEHSSTVKASTKEDRAAVAKLLSSEVSKGLQLMESSDSDF